MFFVFLLHSESYFGVCGKGTILRWSIFPHAVRLAEPFTGNWGGKKEYAVKIDDSFFHQ